jgi:hypothetical protein
VVISSGQEKERCTQAAALLEGLCLPKSSWPTRPTPPIIEYPLDKHLYADRVLWSAASQNSKQFRRIATRFEKTARNEACLNCTSF